MPDQLKVHPGERVDLVDYVHGANTYTQEVQKHLIEREWLDRRARILDGFRVRIEDQVGNPGMITVFNGNAANRDGQLLNNEQVVNDSRSITLLGANLNFYVEIEFLLNESSTDARFFWDPTPPNTPPEPNGSEFGVNVTTRQTPDWRIVSPVSTTSFEQTSNPNSLRVPVGVFRTDGSNRVSVGGTNPGLTLVRAASVLELDAVIGDNTVRVVNSRDFPATTPFTITVDVGGVAPENRTVSGVDRDNGILNITAPLASNHSAGAIVRVTSGTADLVRENIDPSDPALNPLLATPGHPDPAQRLWQSNEVRGSALLQSKETFGVRDDLNIRSLKDQIDYLSALVREMKFGSPRPEVVSAAPPSTFATRPRWFDRVGSLAGARSNTVSIGNGTTTFGDFNGTDGTALITAAVAALPVSGGTIYVKSGTYGFATTATIAKPVVFVGDAVGTTFFNNLNAAGPAISTTANLRFVNIAIQRAGGAATNVIDITGAINLSFDYASVTGGIRLVNVNAGIIATNTSFTAAAGSPVISGTTVTSVLTFSLFTNCVFTSAGILFVCAVDRVRLYRCSLTCSVVLTLPTGGAANLATFDIDECLGTVALLVVATNLTTGTVNGLSIRNNSFTSISLGSGQAMVYLANTGVVNRVTFEGNYVNVTGGVTAAGTPGAIVYIENNTSSSSLSVSDNHVDLPVGSFVVGVWIDQDTLSGSCKISNNFFYRAMEMVRLGGTIGTIDTGALTISGNCHDNVGEHADCYGVRMTNNGRLDQLDILDNVFMNYTSSTLGARCGVDVTTNNTTSPGMAVEVRGNKFFNLYDASVGSGTAYGVIYDGSAGSAMDHQFNICDNVFYRISGDLGCAAVFLNNDAAANTLIARVSRNRINRIGVEGTTAAAYGIYASNFSGGGLSTSVKVTENSIYRVESSTGADPASGVEISNCTAVQILGNYIAAIRSNTTTQPATGGVGIRVQGVANNGLTIADNHIDQGVAAVPAEAQLGIVIYNTGTLNGWSVKNNYIRSSTTSHHQIWIVGDGGGNYVNGVVAGNMVVSRTTQASVFIVCVHVGGASYNIKIDSNSIEEVTYSAASISHRGIVLQGTDAGGTPRAFTISNNSLVGPKVGALLTSANRIGIWLRGALQRTLVTGNMIDWNEPGVLEGIGIKYYDDVTGAGPWSGHLCTSNFVRGDNSAVAGGEVDITTASYTNGFLDSNQLGEPGAVGTIVPGAAAGGWTYGTNKLT